MEIISQLVLLSLGFAVFYVERLYREYTEVRFTFDQNAILRSKQKSLKQTPVISIGDTTGPLNEVYFPSVTVCNLNQVEKSNVCNIWRQNYSFGCLKPTEWAWTWQQQEAQIKPVGSQTNTWHLDPTLIMKKRLKQKPSLLRWELLALQSGALSRFSVQIFPIPLMYE